MKKSKMETLTLGRIIALLSTLALMISTFLPWGGTQDFSVYALGAGKDGVIILSIGIIAFVMLFVKKMHMIFPLLLGVMALVVATIDTNAMLKTARLYMGGSVKIGMYVMLIACIGMVLGTIVEMIQERKKKLNLYYVDK